MTDFAKRARRWERDNREAAELILSDVARYGGEEALPVQWARLQQTEDLPKVGKLPLFDEVAA